TKQRVGTYVDDDVEIAGRTAVRTGRAAALHANALAVGDADGHANLHFTGAHLDAPAVTRRARLRDDLAATTTPRAHLRERERTLVDCDRTRAVPLGTRLRHRARRRAGTRARGARRVGTETYGRCRAVYCVVERQVQLGFEIGAALRTALRTPATAA